MIVFVALLKLSDRVCISKDIGTDNLARESANSKFDDNDKTESITISLGE